MTNYFDLFGGVWYLTTNYFNMFLGGMVLDDK